MAQASSPAGTGSNDAARKMSGWMAKFIAKDRSSVQLATGPEMAPLNDYLLADFGRRCAADTEYQTRLKTLSLHEDADSVVSEDAARSPTLPQQVDDLDGLELPPPPADQEEEGETLPKKTTVFVQNLSYQTTKDEFDELVGAFGTVVTATLPTVKNGLPNAGRLAGYGLVTFEAEKSARECVEALHGRRVGGRELKARLDELRKKKPPKSDRYFAAELFLPKKKKNPCALCAGEGHVADDCPNVVCGACLRRGHREYQCKEAGTLELCTNCGRWGHAWQWCERADGDQRLADAEVRCIFCGQRGHLDCQSAADPPSPDVFCSWCGQKGHTQPSCPTKGVTNARRQRDRERDDDRNPKKPRIAASPSPRRSNDGSASRNNARYNHNHPDSADRRRRYDPLPPREDHTPSRRYEDYYYETNGGHDRRPRDDDRRGGHGHRRDGGSSDDRRGGHDYRRDGGTSDDRRGGHSGPSYASSSRPMPRKKHSNVTVVE